MDKILNDVNMICYLLTLVENDITENEPEHLKTLKKKAIETLESLLDSLEFDIKKELKIPSLSIVKAPQP